MRLVVGSDERTYVTDALVAELRQRGHELLLSDPFVKRSDAWPEMGCVVGAAVAVGDAEQGIVCCYAGTGLSIAANKVPDVRAALCHNAQTAAGVRRWNEPTHSFAVRQPNADNGQPLFSGCPSPAEYTIDAVLSRSA